MFKYDFHLKALQPPEYHNLLKIVTSMQSVHKKSYYPKHVFQCSINVKCNSLPNETLRIHILQDRVFKLESQMVCNGIV